MSARQLQPASLANAQKRIDALREQLDWTVESVERLERMGHHDLAVKLVDEQRRSLRDFIGSVAQDVSPIRRRFNFRRRIAAFSVAALTIVVTCASIGLAHDRSPLQDVRSRLHRAEAMSDPSGRLRELVSIYTTARALPGSRAVRTQVAVATRHTIDDVKTDGDADPDLLADADRVVRDATTGPSTDGSPVQHLGNEITGS